MMNLNECKNRLEKSIKLMSEMNISTLLITPGPNLRYLTGYKAKNLERLTCLILKVDENPRMIVPELEKLAALEAGIESLEIKIDTWNEKENPYEKLQNCETSEIIAVDSQMNASKVLEFQHLLNKAKFVDAKSVMDELRSIKSEWEIEQLVIAGKYIDSVHNKIKDIVVIGETEKQLAKKISNLILEQGHETVDFAIIAAGKNSASPHHEPGKNTIKQNDVLLVDIGGTTPTGYCSDSTRMYVVGKCEKQFEDFYEILKDAQQTVIDSISVVQTCEELDQIGREYLDKNKIGQLFIHRTGHGIGMETHEEPYIVQGNKKTIHSGNAFSVEPGFYIENKYGARIEDILIKTTTGIINCNAQTKNLTYI